MADILDARPPTRIFTSENSVKAERYNLALPLPRKFSNIPSFQWKVIESEEPQTHYHHLRFWLGLVNYWNQVQSVIAAHSEDRLAVEDQLDSLERIEELLPHPLSKWNRHGGNHWTYLPCSYPLTITELFVTVHLAPRPRFPWVEKTGVYRNISKRPG